MNGGRNVAPYPLVSVVIVNFNSGDYLVNCVASVTAAEYPRKEVLVVDNASSDNSVATMLARFPQLHVVQREVNSGYAAAANLGIGFTKGEFIVTMNPDTLVDDRWLHELVEATYRHSHGAFFQPKILLMNNHRVLNTAGNMIHVAGFGIARGIGQLDTEEYKEGEICYASGACVLARRKALQEIGLMEELFLAYGEDKDWGWRASMMGWQSIYVPSSKILHDWNAALRPGKFYLLEFERQLSIWKNYAKRTLVLLLPVLLSVETSVLLYALTKGRFREKIKSYADLIRLRRLIIERRNTTQERRRFSDRFLISRFTTETKHPYVSAGRIVLERFVGLLFELVRNGI